MYFLTCLEHAAATVHDQIEIVAVPKNNIYIYIYSHTFGATWQWNLMLLAIVLTNHKKRPHLLNSIRAMEESTMFH